MQGALEVDFQATMTEAKKREQFGDDVKIPISFAAAAL